MGDNTSEPNEPDLEVSMEDFTELLEDYITAYHVNKYTVKPDEFHKKKAFLQPHAVKRFLNKATIRYLGCSHIKVKNHGIKRLVSHTSSVFKNRTTRAIKHIFRKTSEDTVTAQLKVSTGFTLGVIAGCSGGPPMGGLSAAAGASYSRTKDASSGSSLTTTREMIAEVAVPARHEATAIESEYHTDYIADCEFDFVVDGSNSLEYIWGESVSRIPPMPRRYRIGTKVLNALRDLGYWDRVRKHTFHVKANKLPLLAMCDLVNDQTPLVGDQKVHFSHIFKGQLTAKQHELEVTLSRIVPEREPVE